MSSDTLDLLASWLIPIGWTVLGIGVVSRVLIWVVALYARRAMRRSDSQQRASLK